MKVPTRKVMIINTVTANNSRTQEVTIVQVPLQHYTPILIVKALNPPITIKSSVVIVRPMITTHRHAGI